MSNTISRFRPGQRAIFASLFAVILLVLGASYLHALNKNRTQYLESRLNDVLEAARVIAVANSQWLAESRNILTSLSLAASGMGQRESCEKLLPEFSRSAEGFDVLALARLSGEVICAPNFPNLSATLSDRDYFRRALSSGKFESGSYRESRVSGKWVLPMAISVRDASGAPQLMLTAGRDISWIARFIESYGFVHDVEMMMTDAQGNPILRVPDDSLSLDEMLQSPEVLRRITANREGVFRHVSATEDFVFAHTFVAGAADATHVLLRVPSTQFLVEVDLLFRKGIFYFYVMAGFILLALWFSLGKWVVRPTEELIGAMRRVADGDLSARVRSLGPTREFEYISSCFNRMAESLQRNAMEVRRLTLVDGLLGIGNRRAFEEQLVHEWNLCHRKQQPLAMILLEIDFYLKFNKVYGRVSGDECLQKVAAICQFAAKRPDDMVARYNGSELALLLPRTEVEGARVIAEAIRSRLAKQAIPFESSSLGPWVTLSMGIACSPPAANRLALVRAAEAALDEARTKGRNLVVSPEAVEF